MQRLCKKCDKHYPFSENFFYWNTTKKKFGACRTCRGHERKRREEEIREMKMWDRLRKQDNARRAFSQVPGNKSLCSWDVKFSSFMSLSTSPAILCSWTSILPDFDCVYRNRAPWCKDIVSHATESMSFLRQTIIGIHKLESLKTVKTVDRKK